MQRAPNVPGHESVRALFCLTARLLGKRRSKCVDIRVCIPHSSKRFFDDFGRGRTLGVVKAQQLTADPIGCMLIVGSTTSPQLASFATDFNVVRRSRTKRDS